MGPRPPKISFPARKDFQNFEQGCFSLDKCNSLLRHKRKKWDQSFWISQQFTVMRSLLLLLGHKSNDYCLQNLHYQKQYCHHLGSATRSCSGKNKCFNKTQAGNSVIWYEWFNNKINLKSLHLSVFLLLIPSLKLIAVSLKL